MSSHQKPAEPIVDDRKQAGNFPPLVITAAAAAITAIVLSGAYHFAATIVAAIFS